jgi:hypothetical protein
VDILRCLVLGVLLYWQGEVPTEPHSIYSFTCGISSDRGGLNNRQRDCGVVALSQVDLDSRPTANPFATNNMRIK